MGAGDGGRSHSCALESSTRNLKGVLYCDGRGCVVQNSALQV